METSVATAIAATCKTLNDKAAKYHIKATRTDGPELADQIECMINNAIAIALSEVSITIATEFKLSMAIESNVYTLPEKGNGK